jgi:hypothetical protein
VGDVTDPVVLRSGSAIALNGTITGADNASITLNAPTILNPNITTTDQDITLNGGVSLGSRERFGCKGGSYVAVGRMCLYHPN